jgi:hypothetical protein
MEFEVLLKFENKTLLKTTINEADIKISTDNNKLI